MKSKDMVKSKFLTQTSELFVQGNAGVMQLAQKGGGR